MSLLTSASRLKRTSLILVSLLPLRSIRYSSTDVLTTNSLINMATSFQMHVVPADTGLWKVPQTDAAAQKASELLQRDLQEHHVFFNNEGFHNHIVHHILALYGTGAAPQSLQKGFDDNTGYQRHALKPHDRVPEELKSWDHSREYLGMEQYYPDFLAFFQKEIERDGYEAVLNEYLFKGDAAADDMLLRVHAGFLHPLIQLMYGLEWKQPAIVAEALAQTAVHKPNLGPLLVPAEEAAASRGADYQMPQLASLYEAVRADPKLRDAARWSDSNKIFDGVATRAKDEMLAIIGQVRVRPEEVEERTVEMFNTVMYMAAAAAHHEGKKNKFDFFYMHHVNSSPFYLSVNAQPWIATHVKVRLLEWKIRLDLIQYAARGCPPLSINSITAYQPQEAKNRTKPIDIASQLHNCLDDGHAIKLSRAAGICQQVSQKYEDRDWMVLKGEELWHKVHHMIVDSVQAGGERFVRMAGNDEAWKDVPEQPRL